MKVFKLEGKLLTLDLQDIPLFSNSFQHIQRNIWAKKYLFATLFFKGFAFRLWVVFLNFVKMFPELLSKLHLTLPEETFDSFDCQICGFFSIFEHNSTEVLTVKFHHCSQDSIQNVQRKKWKKMFLYCFLSFFLFWVISSSNFGKSTSAGLSKLNSTFPGETFSIFFWKTYNFAYLFDLKWKKYSNITENDRHRCQATFDVSRETSWWKNNFCWKLCCGNFSLGFWVIFLALLARMFGKFIGIVCLRFQCTVCRHLFKNSWFFENYWKWTETLKFFGSKNSPVLSKKSITCSKEKSSEKVFLENSQSFSDFEHIELSVVRQKMISNDSKTAFDLYKQLNWGKKSFDKKTVAIVFFSDFELVFDGLFKKMEIFVGVV